MNSGGIGYACGFLVAMALQLQAGDASANDKASSESAISKDFEIKGVVQVKAGAFKEAIPDLSRAIELNPTNTTALFYRACAYRGIGSFERSLRDWDRYIVLKPDDDFALKSRASIYNVTGQFEKAIKDWEEGLRLNRNDAMALAMQGFAYAKTGQYHKAEADFTEALHLEPLNESALNNFAWLRATCPVASMRNGKQAIDAATKACEQTGWTNSTSLDTLGAALAEAGQFSKASECQQRAIKMGGSGDLHAMQLRLIKYQQGDAYHEMLP